MRLTGSAAAKMDAPEKSYAEWFGGALTVPSATEKMNHHFAYRLEADIHLDLLMG